MNPQSADLGVRSFQGREVKRSWPRREPVLDERLFEKPSAFRTELAGRAAHYRLGARRRSDGRQRPDGLLSRPRQCAVSRCQTLGRRARSLHALPLLAHHARAPRPALRHRTLSDAHACARRDGRVRARLATARSPRRGLPHPRPTARALLVKGTQREPFKLPFKTQTTRRNFFATPPESRRKNARAPFAPDDHSQNSTRRG